MISAEERIEKMSNVMAFGARDWAKNNRDAYLWGLVLGWPQDALEELRFRYGWHKQTCDMFLQIHTTRLGSEEIL